MHDACASGMACAAVPSKQALPLALSSYAAMPGARLPARLQLSQHLLAQQGAVLVQITSAQPCWLAQT